MSAPRRRARRPGFQDLVNEARLRIGQALPGVDRAQRLGPRHHAHRAVRVDDRDGRSTGSTAIPDKLHVALLELLGLQLRAADAPPTTELRFRLAAPPAEPVAIPAGETEVGTAAHARRASRSSSRPTTTSRSRPRGRRPTSSSAAARPRTSAWPTARRSPKGADQLPFGTPPHDRRRPLPRLRRVARAAAAALDVDCSQARGAGVDPEDPPLRWEVSSGDGAGAGRARRCSLDPTGGFNYGGGVVELQLPARATRATHGRRPARVLGALPPRRAPRAGRARRDLHPPARDLRAHRARPIGALVPAAHAAARRRRAARRERRHARPDASSCATRRCSRSRPGETPRGARARVERAGEPWEPRESFAESGPERPPLHCSTRPAARSSSARPIRDGRRRLAPVRRGAAEGRRGCASPPTATAAAAAATSPPAR